MRALAYDIGYDDVYGNDYERKHNQMKEEMYDKSLIALDKLSKAVHSDYIHVFSDLIVENYHGKIANSIADSLGITEDEIFSLDKDYDNYWRYLAERNIDERYDEQFEEYEVAL